MADKQASPEKEHCDYEATKSSEGNPSGQKNKEERKGFKTLTHTKYLPLFGAALEGNWEKAQEFLDKDRDAATAKITNLGETVLHIAVINGGKVKKFVKELVTKYPASLEEVDEKLNTALYYAAADGNTEVARFLVETNLSLAQKRGSYGGYTPLHMAAKNGHEDIVNFLVSKTINECPSIYQITDEDKSGLLLLKNLIIGNLSGIALHILKHFPDLARDEELQKFALKSLAEKPWLFESGTQLGYWKRLIYKWIAIPKEIAYPKGGDIENSIDSPKDCSATCKNMFGIMRGKVCDMFWKTIKSLVPSIYKTKITHAKTLELVKLICKEMNFSQEETPEFLEEPLFSAIELGIPELVKEIIKTYPPSAFFLDKVERNIFQLAVLHRQEKVFSFIYDMGLYKHGTHFRDNQGYNILHLAGKLQPSNQVSGPALQMQKEMQWFKAVETLVPPKSHKEKVKLLEDMWLANQLLHAVETLVLPKSHKEKVKPSEDMWLANQLIHAVETLVPPKFHKEKVKPPEDSKELTPRQLFAEEHAKLVEDGEKWMKDIASSCSVVAALIVTMVFAAAFTAPGGYNSEGKPNFLHDPTFIIFSIADALALFFSTTSVLIFLGILTSRYSEEDFLESLPRKLIFALITLFISIAAMVVAFGAALHIVFVDIFKLVYIPIAVLAGLPVTLFVRLQFPLLVNVIRSTYGCGILRAASLART